MFLNSEYCRSLNILFPNNAGASSCLTCAAGSYALSAAPSCTPCSVCDVNAQKTQSCSTTANTVCTCNSGYFSLQAGGSCDACETACPSGEVQIQGCSATSNLICASTINCQSSTGVISQCISPQTCFSCSSSSSNSNAVSASVAYGSVTPAASVSSSQSGSVQVGICCATSDPTQDCQQYCKVQKAVAARISAAFVYVTAICILMCFIPTSI